MRKMNRFPQLVIGLYIGRYRNLVIFFARNSVDIENCIEEFDACQDRDLSENAMEKKEFLYMSFKSRNRLDNFLNFI